MLRRTIRKSVLYPHPPARVWRALTDPDCLAAWLMPTHGFAPEVGRSFTFVTKPAPGFDGVVHCEVLEVEPERTLSLTWRGGPLDTVLTFRLEPEGDGTRLHLEHRGFEGLKAVAVSMILDRGWTKMQRTRLPAVLVELSRGEPPTRSTIRAE